MQEERRFLVPADDEWLAGHCRDLTADEIARREPTISAADVAYARRYTRQALVDLHIRYPTDLFDDVERELVQKVPHLIEVNNLTEYLLRQYLRQILSTMEYRDAIVDAIIDERTDAYLDAEGQVIEALVDNIVYQVMTAPEVEAAYDLSAGTVRQALRQGRASGRKADGKTWLMAREEARSIWSKQAVHDFIEIQITANNIKSSSLRISGFEDFFPADAFGKRSKKLGEGKLLTLHLDGFDEPIQTDIDGHKKIFRRRIWRKFYDHHGLREGDRVRIERLSAYEYRVTPVR